MNHFYITTTLPYVNADPHIGFAMEIIRADVLARFYRNIGYDVAFNTGTDEHGQKIYQKAQAEKKEAQAYCDYYAARFGDLKKALNLSYNHFIRTTDSHHQKAAQHFWTLCKKNGDIYKATYKVNYCVGCELEKTDSELINGACPVHPNQKLEQIEEKNYFFRFSRYQKPLLEFYENHPDFIVPSFRYQEMIHFVKKGLKDFSISRVKSKMPWGVPVPGDEEHVMYVWFDALVNYISTLGWPDDTKTFNAFWPGVQIAGKDNLRQQAAMWQAMLLSASLPLSKQIYIEGFITINGQKMSKSLGNVINPLDLVSQYGTDAVRYYVLKEIPAYEDGDFSHNRMHEIYTAELSNELGNLLNRLTTLGEKDGLSLEKNQISPQEWDESFKNHLYNFKYAEALADIWKDIRTLNKDINDFEPWKKQKEERFDFLTHSLQKLKKIGGMISLFMPETGEQILKSTSGNISKSMPLFPKIV